MELLLNAYLSHNEPEGLFDSLVEPGFVFSSDKDKILRGSRQFTNQSIEQFIREDLSCQNAMVLLSPKYRKYGPLILRLYFEHLLAKNWDKISDKSYDSFSSELVSILKPKEALFPFKLKKAVKKIIKKKLLSQLGTINGLNYYILEMRKLNSYSQLIVESVGDLVNNYNSFNNLFLEVMPRMESEFSKSQTKPVFVMAS